MRSVLAYIAMRRSVLLRETKGRRALVYLREYLNNAASQKLACLHNNTVVRREGMKRQTWSVELEGYSRGYAREVCETKMLERGWLITKDGLVSGAPYYWFEAVYIGSKDDEAEDSIRSICEEWCESPK